MTAQTPVLNAPEVQAYVRAVGERVAAASASERQVPVRFIVLDDPRQVNAFAIPGGDIYVYTGLLLAARDESELAGVLAHEVGHVTERHVAQRLVAQVGVETLAGLAVGSNPGLLAQLATGLAGQGALLQYSREQESQADAVAVRLLHQTGYSADGLVHFFVRLAQAEGHTPAVLSFLSNHPAPGDRAREVEQLATQLGAHQGYVGAQSLAALQTRLRNYYAARPPARG